MTRTINTYFTAPNGKRRVRSRTIYFDGGFLHIDLLIQPIQRPRRLGAAPPLAGRSQPTSRRDGKDAKKPIAEPGVLQ